MRSITKIGLALATLASVTVGMAPAMARPWHRHRVCHTEWRHHHRVQVCHWVR